MASIYNLIKSVLPAQNSLSVLTTIKPSLFFVASMQADTLTAQTILFYKVTGAAVPATYRYDFLNQVLEIQPATALDGNTQYQVRILSGEQGPKTLLGETSSREYTSEARQCGGTWDSPESDFDAPILGESGCGLCALYDLGQAGITHLKIVGRGNHPDRMVEDIRAMKRALEILDASKDRETYQKRMKQELFLSGCSKNCYYLPANL